MCGMFVVALAIPESFADRDGGLSAPLAFAVSYVLVRLVHLAIYLVAARGDSVLRRTLVLTAMPVSLAGAVLVGGAVLGPPYQLPLRLLALVIDYVGVYVANSDGWRLPSAALVAERVLSSQRGVDRVRLARDSSYTYLHFPMVAGIVFLAVGVKKVMAYVADSGHHDLSESLT